MSTPIVDRRAAPAQWAVPWRAMAVALAVAVPLLALAGCAPTQKADCDQLLSDNKYQQVLKDCPNPYQRASAYLGLGGFDLVSVYTQIQNNGNSLTPLGVINALGLTPANISTKRQYIEQAVFAVAHPEDTAQAFALLVASAMGMMVSSIEFLDPVVDGNFTLAMSETALGIGTTGLLTNFTVSPATIGILPYFSGVVAGTPYVLACTDLAPPFCTTAQIDTDISVTYGNGAGFDSGAAGPAISLAPANPVSLVFQITGMTLPLAVNPAQAPVFNAFAGQGNTAQGFTIGLEGYLNYLQAAVAVLTPAGSNSSSPSTLSDAIDSFRGQLDNGAQCLGTLLGDPTIPTGLNAIYPIYQAAIGTSARPMPGGAVPANFFQAYNQVGSLNLALYGVPPIAFPANDFIFGSTLPGTGTVGAIGYRFLYPKQSGLGAFTPAQATPRIDETYTNTNPTFQQAFEAMLLAPAVSPSRDGKISYAELLCINAGAPPTGVTATAGFGQVTLTWNTVSGATSYSIYRDTSPGVTQTKSTATRVSAAAVSPYTDSGLLHGTTYYYVITSTNASGEGGISREVSATP